MIRTRGLGRLEVLVLIVIATFTASLAACRGSLARSVHDEKKCANVLRAVGLACIQYADDKRLFPRRLPLSKLGGGLESDEASFAARLLVKYDYALPEQFICPATSDEHANEAPRLQLLTVARDLSYGYTRRGLGNSSMSTHIVFADRSRRVLELDDMPLRTGPLRGNHASAILGVCLDSHVVRITPRSEPVSTHTIAGCSKPFTSDGFVGVLPD